jgi:hypothetical protein
MADQDRISECTLVKQVQLIFARGEIDRPEIPGGDFAVHRHGKCGADEWAGNTRPNVALPL